MDNTIKSVYVVMTFTHPALAFEDEDIAVHVARSLYGEDAVEDHVLAIPYISEVARG